MNALIGGYNSFIGAASKYTDEQPKSNEIVNEFSSISRTYAKGLTNVGINLNLDGSLELNEDTFRRSMQDGDITENLAPVRSFTNSLLRKSDQIALNPMRYVDKTVVEYKNPGRNFANPYITSEYSGMLFNSYC
jgi:flagellar hook-associated protein 2